MATRALLQNIQLARARAKPQPRAETKDETTYREVLQNIAATLGVVGQGVNIARAVEPWVAAAGYDGAPTTAIDAEASRLSAQLGEAYPGAAPQPQTIASGAQAAPQQAQTPERMGGSVMEREGRREALTRLPQDGPPSRAEPEGVRFNRMTAPKSEQMFVRNEQDAVRGGMGPLRREWDETSTPVNQAELQRRVFGNPLNPPFASEQEAIEAANQLRFDNTMARGKSWGYARKSAEGNIAAAEAQEQQDYQQRDQAKAQMWQSAANAATQTAERDAIAAGMDQQIAGMDQEQAMFDEMATALPPPPSADPMQRQAELNDIAQENPSVATQVAGEIDRFASVPTFETYAEAQAAMQSAVMAGDIEAAQRVLQGASRSPLRDVAPVSYADRLSGAHVRRAMKELSDMGNGMNAAAMRAAQAMQQAAIAERRLSLQETNIESQVKDRLRRQGVQAEKLELAKQNLELRAQNIFSQIASRELRDELLVDTQKYKTALMQGQTAKAYAIANSITKRLPAQVRKDWIDYADRLANMRAAWEAEQDRRRAAGEPLMTEPPTDQNLMAKILRGEVLPSREKAKSDAIDKRDEKRSTRRMTEAAVKHVTGIGSRPSAPKMSEKDKQTVRAIDSVIAKTYDRNGETSSAEFVEALPELKKAVELLSPEARAAQEVRLRSLAAGVGIVGEKYDNPPTRAARKAKAATRGSK